MWTVKQNLSKLWQNRLAGLSVFSSAGLFTKPSVVFAATCNGSTDAALQACLQQSPIVHDLQIIVNFLSAGVGVVVVTMLVVGGIQYMVAGDNPSSLTAAKNRITNALIALLAFAFTFAFINWLIPGGFFN